VRLGQADLEIALKATAGFSEGLFFLSCGYFGVRNHDCAFESGIAMPHSKIRSDFEC